MGTLGLAITLVVRLYDNGMMPEADRAAATTTASDILLASNVPTTWPDCAPPKPRPHVGGSEEQEPPYVPPAFLVCDRPMGAGEVAVRLVRDPRTFAPPHARTVSLGYSLIDPARRAGSLATIYLDRVEWLAADTGVDVRVVLGRAIAHEIGHLLLGTARHANTGLMRAIWSRQTLEKNAPGDWLFTARETGAMHRALGRRVPVAQAAENIAWETR